MSAASRSTRDLLIWGGLVFVSYASAVATMLVGRDLFLTATVAFVGACIVWRSAFQRGGQADDLTFAAAAPLFALEAFCAALFPVVDAPPDGPHGNYGLAPLFLPSLAPIAMWGASALWRKGPVASRAAVSLCVVLCGPAATIRSSPGALPAEEIVARSPFVRVQLQRGTDPPGSVEVAGEQLALSPVLRRLEQNPYKKDERDPSRWPAALLVHRVRPNTWVLVEERGGRRWGATSDGSLVSLSETSITPKPAVPHGRKILAVVGLLAGVALTALALARARRAAWMRHATGATHLGGGVAEHPTAGPGRVDPSLPTGPIVIPSDTSEAGAYRDGWRAERACGGTAEAARATFVHGLWTDLSAAASVTAVGLAPLVGGVAGGLWI